MFSKYLNTIGRLSMCQGFIDDVVPKNDQRPHCPHCRGACYAHGVCRRLVRVMNTEGALRTCKIKVRRFRCRCCSKTFCEDLSHVGILPYARRNERLHKAMGKQMMQGVSNQHIARNFKINPGTEERTLHRLFHLHLREQLSHPCPVHPGIDEHSIHKGRRYAVTLVDLKNHQVYEVIEGKESAKLEAALRRLRGRSGVKMVCMDLCPPFRNVVQRLFPRAKIVADRFHVIRLVIDTLLDFSREAEPDIRWKRGLISALRKNHESARIENLASPLAY